MIGIEKFSMLLGGTFHHHRGLHCPLTNSPPLERIERHGNVCHERSDERDVGRLKPTHPSVITLVADTTNFKLSPLFSAPEHGFFAQGSIDHRSALAFQAFENPLGEDVLRSRRTNDGVLTKHALAQGNLQSRKIEMTKEKTQITPKGEEIPIPKRSDFLKNLKKAATPDKSTKRPKK
jgi:hypothetical protein